MREKVYITPDLYEKFSDIHEYLETITRSHLDKDGNEVPNPKPLVIAGLGDSRPLTLQEQIKRLFRTEVSMQANMQGHETFEEANDFDISEEIGTLPDTTNYTAMEEEYPFEEPLPEPSSTPPKKEAAPVEPPETPPEPPPSE